MSVTRSIARLFRANDVSMPLSQIVGDLDDAFDVSRVAGVRVSKRAALGVAAFFRGVSVISRYVAKTPLIVYRRIEPQGKERAKDHPAYKLLRRQPNPQMTAFTVKQTAMAHVLVHGNAYLFVRRDRAGRPLELWPLLPDRTWPIRVNGQLWYTTHLTKFAGEAADAAAVERGEQIKIPAANVIHVKGLGFDGLTGYSVMRYAAHTLGLAIANRDFGSTFYERGGANRVVLETPKTLSEPAAGRIIAGWKRMTEGRDNWWRTAILEEDTKAHVLSVTAKDAQMIDAMKFTNKEIANWLNLPEHMVGGDGRTAYASLEQENQRVLDDTIDPWLCAFEAECESRLLTDVERDAESHEVEFLRESLVRVNLVERFSTFATGLLHGVYNVDEVRNWLGLNPLPDGQGETYRVQMNMTASGGDDTTSGGNGGDTTSGGNGGADEDADADDDSDEAEENRQRRDRDAVVYAAARQALLDGLRRMTTRLATAARKAATRPRDFGTWCEAFARDHALVIRAAVRPTVAVVLASRGQPADVERIAADVAAALCGRMRDVADRLYNTTAAAELPAAMERELVAAEATWPAAIAAEHFAAT